MCFYYDTVSHKDLQWVVQATMALPVMHRCSLLCILVKEATCDFIVSEQEASMLKLLHLIQPQKDSEEVHSLELKVF